MSFWTNQKLQSNQHKHSLITPFSVSRMEQNAYALGVDGEYAITSPENGGRKQTAKRGENITIPPGQFALLMTEERIAVPSSAMAFISVKAKLKLRGLVNVSGFHVDPGFHGRLKFAVYNAGSVAIDLHPGQRLFLIWYCDLDDRTDDTYSGSHQGQDGITPEDVMSIRGILCTPAGILERVDKLEQQLISKIDNLQAKVDTHQLWSRPLTISVVSGLVVAVLLIFVKPLFERTVGSARTGNPSVMKSLDVDGATRK